MNAVGFVYHDDYLKHDTGVGHPERPDRLKAIIAHLSKSGTLNNLHQVRPVPASLEWVQKVHPMSYIEMIERRCLAGETVLDSGDTHVCKESYAVALLAAGGVLRAVDEVLGGSKKRMFCLVRPPGHHAETQSVM